MQSRLRHSLSALALLLLAAACSDAPTSPITTLGTGPREGVWIPPEPGECDPYQDINWCEDDPGDGPCTTSQPSTDEPEEYVGSEACTPGGGPGGGDGDDTPAADTCQTGDAVLDDPMVKAGLADLWQRSNPDAPQSQRVEQSAWIVQNSDGSYGVRPMTNISQQGPCSVNGSLLAPANAVAWVHTHPFRRGEEQISCGAFQRWDSARGSWVDVLGPDGRPDYPEYQNQPSADDRALLSSINRGRKTGQPVIAGVVLDKDQTTAFTEKVTAPQTAFPRCGY
jgi:hypothetical protein